MTASGKPPEAPSSDGAVAVSRGEGFDGIGAEVARVSGAVDRRTANWRSDGLRIGLVPIIGEPHVGHLTLIEAASDECDRVVVVTRAAAEVLAEPDGLRLLSNHGADLLFLCPGTDLVSQRGGPDGDPPAGGFDREMEGRFARAEFLGAVDRIGEWIRQVGVDAVYQSGARFQMALVLADLLRSRGLSAEVRVVDAARGPGGIAPVASIDRLKPDERDQVAGLQRVLTRMAARLADGASTVAAETAWARDALTSAGIASIDYLDVRDARTLEPVDHAGGRARIFAAVWIGTMRLVDSIPVADAPQARPVAVSR